MRRVLLPKTAMVLCLLVGCSGRPISPHSLTSVNYARTACTEWRPFSESRHDAIPKTDLLPLARTDGGLAAKDSTYATLGSTLERAVDAVYPGGPASTAPPRPVPEQLAVAADQACANIPSGH
jgi:hypothetical protein